MKRKDWFNLGLRWIGLYGLAVAIEHIFDFSYQEFVRGRELAKTDGIFQISQWMSVLEPVALSLISLCLVKKTSYVQEFVYREEPDALIDLKGGFETTIKLYGAYLVVVSIPSCLSLLANLIIVFYAPSYLSISPESETLKSNGTSILVTVAIGLWCVLKEKSITRLVFR